MAGLAVRLFGAPDVIRDGVSVPFARRKTLALLAYLAISGRAHNRDMLAVLFWPELDAVGSRTALRHALSDLHRILGPDALVLEQDQARLSEGVAACVDVVCFRRALARVDAHSHPASLPCEECLAALIQAVDLCQGDFLAGFSLPDSAEFDTWQAFEAENLRLALGGALEKLVQGHAARGAYDVAIGYGRRWLALDALSEPAHRALMQLHAWAGDRSAALRQYQECVRVLAAELGIEPDPETSALAEAIRAGGPGGKGEMAPMRPFFLAPRHNLPPTRRHSSAGRPSWRGWPSGVPTLPAGC